MTYSKYDNKVKDDSDAFGESEKSFSNSLKPHRNFAIILLIATVIAVFVNFLPVIHFKPVSEVRPLTQNQLLSKSRTLFQRPGKKAEEPVEEAPKVIYFKARPSADPTPPPAITSFKLFSYGRELGTDGFTTYTGDRPVVLSLEIVPFMSHPPVEWSVSDETAATLSVSNDRKQCEFSALKGIGKIELTVSCNEAVMVIPVYLWDK